MIKLVFKNGRSLERVIVKRTFDGTIQTLIDELRQIPAVFLPSDVVETLDRRPLGDLHERRLRDVHNEIFVRPRA